MTPAQILETIRNQVYESTAAFYSDAEIYSYLWQAEQEIAELVKCTEARTAVAATSVTGTEYYDLASDVAIVTRVTWDGLKLKKIDYRDRDAVDYTQYGSTLSSGNPYMFYQWGNKIGLYPVPDSAKSIGLHYYKIPDQLVTGTSGSTAFTIPSMFARYLPDYALYRMYAKDQDDGRANFHRQQWEANLTRAHQFWAQRLGDDHLYVVKDTDNYPETELGMI